MPRTPRRPRSGGGARGCPGRCCCCQSMDMPCGAHPPRCTGQGSCQVGRVEWRQGHEQRGGDAGEPRPLSAEVAVGGGGGTTTALRPPMPPAPSHTHTHTCTHHRGTLTWWPRATPGGRATRRSRTTGRTQSPEPRVVGWSCCPSSHDQQPAAHPARVPPLMHVS